MGADWPIREYNSRDMPSGFLARSAACFACEGPGVDGGRENTERTSAALGPAILTVRPDDSKIRKGVSVRDRVQRLRGAKASTEAPTSHGLWQYKSI